MTSRARRGGAICSAFGAGAPARTIRLRCQCRSLAVDATAMARCDRLDPLRAPSRSRSAGAAGSWPPALPVPCCSTIASSGEPCREGLAASLLGGDPAAPIEALAWPRPLRALGRRTSSSGLLNWWSGSAGKRDHGPRMQRRIERACGSASGFWFAAPLAWERGPCWSSWRRRAALAESQLQAVASPTTS